MKTISKKSKVYDEALKLQKKIISISTNLQAISESISIELHKLEDELRESEDEKIYREIYSIVHCYYKRKANLLVSSQDRNEMREKWEKAKSFLEKQKKHKPIEFKNDELVEIIKGEFEGFRNLLKKKGIDYEPQRGYWEGFARLFDSSAREYVKGQKEQRPERINVTEMVAKYRATDEYVEGEYKGKPVNCMIRAYEKGIRDTLSKVKEQKPAWSEG